MATILVVDDYPVTQRMRTNQLYKQGYNVVTASNGREALTALTETPVDLIIVDLAMPGMGERTMLRHLRADARYAQLPVIMLTVGGREQDRPQARSGVDAFLTRPTSSWQLSDIVSDLLRHQGALAV